MKYYELIADIAKNNKRLAITYSDVQFTYEELDKMIDTISYELMYNRIETNAKVGVSCQNKLTTLLILIALNKLSAVAVPIYPQTGKSKMIIPELSEPPVRTLGATIPENESRLFR